MWFDFARDQLCGELSNIISGDIFITVMGKHLPMSTVTTEQEACLVVTSFCTAFGNISNLSSSMFLDVKGKDKAGLMYRLPRPPNVCHMEVYARIPMASLSNGFNVRLSEYFISYSLALLRVFQAAIHGTASTSRKIYGTALSVSNTLDEKVCQLS